MPDFLLFMIVGAADWSSFSDFSKVQISSCSIFSATSGCCIIMYTNLQQWSQQQQKKREHQMYKLSYPWSLRDGVHETLILWKSCKSTLIASLCTIQIHTWWSWKLSDWASHDEINASENYMGPPSGMTNQESVTAVVSLPAMTKLSIVSRRFLSVNISAPSSASSLSNRNLVKRSLLPSKSLVTCSNHARSKEEEAECIMDMKLTKSGVWGYQLCVPEIAQHLLEVSVQIFVRQRALLVLSW